MKAVIIADDDTAIERISIVLKSAGYDVIIYRWLMKALDNIEEIAPHLLLISTRDYPRHWKILSQYVRSSIAEKNNEHPVQIILYTGDEFSDEDRKKASELGVRGVFTSCDVTGLEQLREVLEHGNDIFSGTLTPDEPLPSVAQILGQHDAPSASGSAASTSSAEAAAETLEKKEILSPSEMAKNIFGALDLDDDGNQYEFIFTAPKTHKYITGLVKQYHNARLEFEPDYLPEHCIEPDDDITEATLLKDGVPYAVNATVSGLSSGLVTFLIRNS